MNLHLSAPPRPAGHSAGHRQRSHQGGVTLVELMVGMVIGLLATLVIAQVAIVYEGQKRNTTAGSDAQVTGAVALQTLQRDIQMSGYGIAGGGGAGCTLHGKRGAAIPPWDGKPLAPILITNGTDTTRGSPDTLELLLSDQQDFSLPIRIYQNHRRDDTEFVLDDRTNVGNKLGDLMVVIPNPNPLPSAAQISPTWCSVFNISTDPATTGNRIVHQAGASGPWNQDSTGTIFPGALNADISYAAGSHLVNLGRLRYRQYSLSGDTTGATLQLHEASSTTGGWNTTNPEALFAQIVNLQAVYGRDTVTATPGPYRLVDTWDSTAPTTPEGWARVIAVRIAVVARSNQYEKEEVTTSEPEWKPDGSTDSTIKVDHLSDWRHYRYKLFEAVVPLRNMLWQS